MDWDSEEASVLMFILDESRRDYGFLAVLLVVNLESIEEKANNWILMKENIIRSVIMIYVWVFFFAQTVYSVSN